MERQGRRKENRDRDLPSRKPIEGFTLVEWIIAAALTVIVGASIAVTFRNGITAWERISVLEKRDAETFLLAEQMRQELKQALFIGTAPFTGEKNHLRFGTLQETMTEEGKRSFQFEIISYQWDLAQGRLIRTVWTYPEFLADESGRREEDVSGLTGMEFRYPYALADSAGVEWRERWDSSAKLPAAVEVRFQTGDRTWSSLLWIPTGRIGSL